MLLSFLFRLLNATPSGGSDVNELLVIVTALSVAVAFGGLYYTIRRDRSGDTVKERERSNQERAGERAQVEKIREDLTRLTIALVGVPPDSHTGLGKVDGFVDEVRDHNKEVDAKFKRYDAEFANIHEELRTVNGGATVKGRLAEVQTDIRDIRDQVTALSAEEKAK